MCWIEEQHIFVRNSSETININQMLAWRFQYVEFNTWRILLSMSSPRNWFTVGVVNLEIDKHKTELLISKCRQYISDESLTSNKICLHLIEWYSNIEFYLFKLKPIVTTYLFDGNKKKKLLEEEKNLARNNPRVIIDSI